MQREEKTGMKGTPEGMRVLIANEPLAYREVISAAFKEAATAPRSLYSKTH